MKKTKILIIGYSSFVRRRVIPSLKKNKKINYCICSKSNKINHKNKILHNYYLEGLKNFNPDLVYISTVNSLHYKYAKSVLNNGFNLIVDKPITLDLKKTNELLNIAKKKRLFFAEATLFNYHRVFKIIEKLCNGKDKIEHVQSNLNLPLVKSIKEIKKIKGDCEADTATYAAAIIRLFTDNSLKKINVYKNYFKNTKLVKSFYIMANSKNITYVGNFAFQREYSQQIIFYTKNKIIFSPQRIFALPPNKNLELIIKTKNTLKKINVLKDDCIKNFFNLVFNCLKRKNHQFFYNIMLQEAKLRNIIKIGKN